METGDIYVFAHHTSAITIARRSDKTSLLAAMAQGRQTALATTQAGRKVGPPATAPPRRRHPQRPRRSAHRVDPVRAPPEPYRGADALETLRRATFKRRDAGITTITPKIHHGIHVLIEGIGGQGKCGLWSAERDDLLSTAQVAEREVAAIASTALPTHEFTPETHSSCVSGDQDTADSRDRDDLRTDSDLAARPSHVADDATFEPCHAVDIT